MSTVFWFCCGFAGGYIVARGPEWTAAKAKAVWAWMGTIGRKGE